MGWYLSCPRCGSRKIQRVCLQSPSTHLQWYCEECGESCHDPGERHSLSAKVDFTVGLAIFAVLACLALCYLI